MLSNLWKYSVENQYCFIVYNYLTHAQSRKSMESTVHVSVFCSASPETKMWENCSGIFVDECKY